MRRVPHGSLGVLASGVAALTVVLSFSGNAAGQGPPACFPSGDRGNPPTVDVQHGRSPQGGPETTVAFEGGGYRVFRCAPDGTLQTAMTVGYATALGGPDDYLPVSKIERQPDGRYRAGAFTYAPFDGSDVEALVAWKGERGQKLRNSVIPPTEGTELAEPETGGATTSSTTSATPGCEDSYYLLWPARWANGYYPYYANLSDMPQGDETRQEITKGHHSWDYTNNPCGFNDITDLVSDYRGEQPFTHFSRISDGTNIVDFGDMDSVGADNAMTIGYTYVWWYSNGDMAETDQRYNVYKEWSISGDGTKYDVYNVATHETGHSIGIDGDYEGSTHGNLTMYAYTYHGETKDRSLARGDILGMRELYP